MFTRRYGPGPGLAFFMVAAGAGLIYNSLRGFFSREGMYDRDSSETMVWANIFSLIAGAVMLLYGLGYLARRYGLLGP